MTTDPTTADGGGEIISPPEEAPSSPISNAVSLAIAYLENEEDNDPEAIAVIQLLVELLLQHVREKKHIQ
jgi:hypothetical protein